MGPSQITAQLLKILPVNNILGEGVIFNEAEQAIWWTDIKSAVIYRYWLDTEQLDHWNMPEAVGCFGFVSGKAELIVALASGIACFDLESERLDYLSRPEAHLPGNRFNDGRVDRQGRFWAGTMVEAPEKNTGPAQANLYRLDDNGHATAVIAGLEIANGLCWSPDGSRLYHADSPKRQITQYQFDAISGDVAKPRLFAQTPEGIYPDGATVDSQGYLWSAQWGGSRVVRYDPAGKEDYILQLPVSQPTCVAFGGPDMDWLFVTSAREGLTDEELAQQPQAGDLFIYRLGVKGLTESSVKTEIVDIIA